jgi:uncharacterized protein YggE
MRNSLRAILTSRQRRNRPLHALLLAAAVAGASCASAQPPGGAEDPRGAERLPTLTVSGSAEVSADPDQAVVRLGVVAEGAEASAAQGEVNRVLRQVLDAVASLDVPERAVQTEELSLSPVYSDFRPRPNGEPEEPRITGYRASSVVSVELDDLSRIGDVVDAGIEAGANQLQGISFGLRDGAAAQARALREAVQDARARADTIAEAMNVRIDAVREVLAGDSFQNPPVPLGGARFNRVEMAATPVQPGQVAVSASVTVTYYIRERAD